MDRLVVHSINYQQECWDWQMEALGANPESSTVLERNRRFIEEALELVQSLNLSKEDVLKLVDYVYSREVGKPGQEVGGTLVTLATLCQAAGLDMVYEGNKELDRVKQPEVMDKIRKKQVSKQLHGIGGTPVEGKEKPQ